MEQSEAKLSAKPVQNKVFHRHLLPLCHHRGLRKRIGIMGGSFNPAHFGHFEISKTAKKTAKLDEVWWLVSPQNPLKNTQGMAPLPQRLAHARNQFECSWIRISNFEETHKLHLTIDTLIRLRVALPYCDFVWVMGADNLVQFPKWHRAKKLSRSCAMMVMNRPSYGYQALASQGAYMLGKKKRKRNPSTLNRTTQGWSFIPQPRHAISATQIRQET